MSHTYETLPENVKQYSAQELQKLLYSTIDLNMQIKESHWTMAGREFLSVHRLFDEVAEVIEDTVDDIAERIAQLGHKPEGTLQKVAEKSSLPTYPKSFSSIDEHIEVIGQRLAFVTSQALQAMANMEENGDPISVDLLTARTREIDKLTWLVESHLPQRK
ncbi:DNA starvation/stationary phase protection protein Dps [Endozoicomonas elysicola]|uniref:DNA starvation/stationary phase protection protein Dps n=1 Tax=Endozoicomonas elysicola TaxID=305900 RepID=UPI0003708466|nr:DNA starvation/stationary phase protection protein Dps [Endozoicomonas elysicola]